MKTHTIFNIEINFSFISKNERSEFSHVIHL